MGQSAMDMLSAVAWHASLPDHKKGRFAELLQAAKLSRLRQAGVTLAAAKPRKNQHLGQQENWSSVILLAPAVV